ncbi:MAG: hypothetical protein ABH858_05150, partial [Candidatus Omnitrophota bacterium]
ELAFFCRRFAFRRGIQKRLLSLPKDKRQIQRLKKTGVKKSDVYKILNPLSFETILFFHAYFKNKALRNNNNLFFGMLDRIKLKINGEDLKSLRIKPHCLYGKIFEFVTYAKIEKGFSLKRQEIDEAKKVFKRLAKNFHNNK